MKRFCQNEISSSQTIKFYFECPNMDRYEAVNSPPCKWVAGIQYGTCSCGCSTLFTFEDVTPSSLGASKLIVDYMNRSLIHQEDILDGNPWCISSVPRHESALFIFHWEIPISGKSSTPTRCSKNQRFRF